jgi:hypothetical protein
MGVRAGLRARPFAFARLDDSVLNEDKAQYPRDRVAADPFAIDGVAQGNNLC